MRWIYKPSHPKANARGFVAEADLSIDPSPKAINAPILSGRFYENMKATDGTDIGSRKRHREYMKMHGLTTADDFKSQWQSAEAERQRVREEGRMPTDAKRREALERGMYRIAKP